jgi:chromosome segregation ATPase
MYKQVLKDKSKIEETVEKLDEYKKEALQKTWEIVNASVIRSFNLSRASFLTSLDFQRVW